MNRAEIDAYNAKELGLAEKDMPEYNRLMTSPMSRWPSDLQRLVKRRTDEVGFCGDVLAHAVADWIKGRQ